MLYLKLQLQESPKPTNAGRGTVDGLLNSWLVQMISNIKDPLKGVITSHR